MTALIARLDRRYAWFAPLAGSIAFYAAVSAWAYGMYALAHM